MKKSILMLVAMLTSSMFYAQFNDYKYIIVPKKFEAFKQENQYLTSTLIKHNLTEFGYTVVYDDALPPELKMNRCLGVTTDIDDSSSMFTTKLNLVFKDCNGVEVYTSLEGKSKIKEFKEAYKEAISRALEGLRGIPYNYNGDKGTIASTPSVSATTTTTQVQEEPVITLADNSAKTIKTPVATESAIERIEQTATTAVGSTSTPILKEVGDILYAQPKQGGYQLVDSTPQVIYFLKSTAAPDVFIVEKEGKNGVVYKKDNTWFIEFDGGQAGPQPLNIKF
ncbi:hypothetical protein [Croceivirga sp. JEA036]|uniref:hypothetical protein n=1 Tax=Croceivirga sp. JEA036 TaxID=2721162 RepID=UPI00143C54AF|nr:hypothetical protein [Croceivirga sp. JEA036]NJB37241.1 hypothetical protein [Croceivirga sp. JEA036]